MHKRAWGLALAGMVLAGCATIPTPQSREEWQRQHARTLTGYTPEQVLAAAEQVLRLADEDFAFDYPDGGLVAHRKWAVFAVIARAAGTDYWKFTTAPTETGTKVTLEITRLNQSTIAAPVVAGPGVYVMNSSTPGEPMAWSPPYELFWARLHHVLTGTGPWLTCDQFKAGKDAADKAGIDTLCSVTTDDKAPAAAG